MILSNERTEFKKAIAELKMEIVDKISSAVIERVTDVVHNSAEDVAGTGSVKFSIEEEGADSARSRWTVVDGLWGKVQCAEEEVPGEEQHSNNNIGKEFRWNSNADEFSPIFDMLHSGSAHRGSATVCDHYELLYSAQTNMKRYCFKRTQFNNDLHEVVYSKQRHLKRYKFLKTVVTDSNFDDSEDFLKKSAEFSDEECALISFNLMNDECMKLTKEDLCLFENLSARSASWHDNDSLPDSFNSNACLSVYLPPSLSASCTSEESSTM